MGKNQYTIINEIKRGGQGIVFKCQDSKGNIKIMKIVNLNQTEVCINIEKSKKEGEILSTLSHNNIIKIYQYYQDSFQDEKSGITFPKVLYIIQEFIEAGDLNDYLHSNVEITIEVIIKLYSQIKDALQYIHSKNIIHRDISSENILVTKNWDPVITDFGISSETKGNKFYLTSQCHGKLFYTPREIIHEGKAFFESDYWSLGVLMLQLAFGKPIREIRKDCLISNPCEDINFPIKQLDLLRAQNKNIILIPIIEGLLNHDISQRKMIDIQSSPDICSEIKKIYQLKLEKKQTGLVLREQEMESPIFVMPVVPKYEPKQVNRNIFFLDVPEDKVVNEKVSKIINNKPLRISSKITNPFFSEIFSNIIFNLSHIYNSKIVKTDPIMFVDIFVDYKRNNKKVVQLRTKGGLWNELEYKDLRNDYYKIIEFLTQNYEKLLQQEQKKQ